MHRVLGGGLRVAVTACAVIALGGCSTLGKSSPQKNAAFFDQNYVEDRSVVWPVRSVSNFDDGLACMDAMLRDNHVGPILITSKTIPDASGKVFVATKDMVITSLSEMSRTSNAFRFVDYEVDPLKQDTVQTLTGLLLQANQMQIQVPQLYVSGAISFLDQNVMIDRRSLGAGTNQGEVGYSRDLIGTVMGAELHLGDFQTRTLIPGVHSANEMALANKGAGLDLGGRIRKAGVQFEFGNDYSQGVGPATRTLVDLSMIELVGKWARLPYWECLSLDSAHPEFQRQLRQWYLKMDDAQRAAFIARGLRANGYYDGDVSGRVIPAALRDAVRRYQVDAGIAATGDLSYETYDRLARDYVRSDGQGGFSRIGWGDVSRRMPTELAAIPRNGTPALESTDPRPARVTITLPSSTTEYTVGQSVYFNISTDRTGYLRCYYRDAKNAITQVYPNPLQTAAQVEGNRSLLVPDPNNPQSFAIEFSRPGSEEVRCYDTAHDVSARLPATLNAPPLEPLSVASFDELERAYATAAGGLVGRGVRAWTVVRP
ncbi:DUF4384 domain-containing protein [Cognatilysobacter terrigena]|uniref:DUF4384 domain-containing protein n=1 Tax=Cognatilysobacter terrigena TaxID=2488749 RepID=UPI00105EC6DF|nr:DUF4384 domain-containing protein [Lysobacter terrigena]